MYFPLHIVFSFFLAKFSGESEESKNSGPRWKKKENKMTREPRDLHVTKESDEGRKARVYLDFSWNLQQISCYTQILRAIYIAYTSCICTCEIFRPRGQRGESFISCRARLSRQFDWTVWERRDSAHCLPKIFDSSSQKSLPNLLNTITLLFIYRFH